MGPATRLNVLLRVDDDFDYLYEHDLREREKIMMIAPSSAFCSVVTKKFFLKAS